MKTQEILKPLEYVDEQALRIYTAAGKRLGIDHGRKRYITASALWGAHVLISDVIGRLALGNCSYAELIPRVLINGPDGAYNMNGVIYGDQTKDDSDSIALDPVIHPFKKINSRLRLPVLIGGLSLVAKSGTDLVGSVSQGQPLNSSIAYELSYGLGLLSLASSMYIKEQDPKLLQKNPFWRSVYNWVKQKTNDLSPAPAPQPIPIHSFSNDLEFRLKP